MEFHIPTKHTMNNDECLHVLSYLSIIRNTFSTIQSDLLATQHISPNSTENMPNPPNGSPVFMLAKMIRMIAIHLQFSNMFDLSVVGLSCTCLHFSVQTRALVFMRIEITLAFVAIAVDAVILWV